MIRPVTGGGVTITITITIWCCSRVECTNLTFDIAGETVDCKPDINVRTPPGAASWPRKTMLVISEFKVNTDGEAMQSDTEAQGIASL